MKITCILVPTDLSPFGEVGVRAAADLAHRLGAELTLFHVVPGNELETLVNAHIPRHPVDLIYHDLAVSLMDQFRRVAPPEVRRHLRVQPLVTVGNPVAEILRAAQVKSADMIVLATHGRTGLTRMVLGSVAEQVVRRAPCPVLTVRPAEAMVGAEA